MSFEPITTEEAFKAAIDPLLKQERETLEKKFADYETIKGTATESAKKAATLEKALEEINKKYAGIDKTVETLTGENNGYKSQLLKLRVASEVGVPYTLAERLKGDSEEDVRKDAEAILKLVNKSNPTAPLKDNEPPAGDNKKVALTGLLHNLTNKGE